MPLRYKIFEDIKLAYVIGLGKVGVNDLLNNLDELSADPKYTPPMKKLIDYRFSEKLGLTSQGLTQFTNLKQKYKDRFKDERCAVLVKHDYDFGMAGVHSARIEPAEIETNVFRSIEKALSWLEVDLGKNELDSYYSSSLKNSSG